MKKIIYSLLILLFLTENAYSNIYTRNIIVHLKDKSRIVSNDFNIKLPDDYVYNPYIRVKSLNISLITYTSPEDTLKHNISAKDLYNKVRELNFVDRVQGEENKYVLKIIFKDKKEVIPNDASLFKYKGFETPSDKITVLRYDEYNKTWVPAYIDLSEIEKIEFRQVKIPSVKKMKKSDVKKEKGYKRKVLFSSDDADTDGSLFASLKEALMNFKTNKASIILRVNFPFNSYSLNKKAKSFLNVVSKVISLEEFKDLKLRLVGFTDNIGKEKYNKRLSVRRALAVKKYLSGNGRVSSRSLKTEGYGDKMPIAPNTTEYYRGLNRRVELIPLVY